MHRHHFNARRKRLEKLVETSEARAAELARLQDETPLGKRLRTITARTLERHRQSLDNLLKVHGATFGVVPGDKDSGEA